MPSSTTVTLNDTVGITDALVRSLILSRTLTDTVGVTDVVRKRYNFHLTNTVGLPDTLHKVYNFRLNDTVGISDYLAKRWQIRLADSVGLTSAVAAPQVRIQYDTWRPVTRPDNVLVLACRTPEGEHDSPTGYTHMTFWTFHNDGSNENIVWQVPSDYSWASYGHPEWDPGGNSVVAWAETAADFRIVRIDATSWDRGA